MAKTLMEAVHGLLTLIENMSLELTGRVSSPGSRQVSDKIEKVDKQFEGMDLKMKGMEFKMQVSIESLAKDVGR